MAKYTIELGTMMQGLLGLNQIPQYPAVNQVIENARPLIFDFDYQIFDPAYKKILETKFLRHFYFYEVCDTPYGKWKAWLEEKFNLQMPYFNQLYNSQLLAFSPLYNVNVSKTGNRKNNVTKNKNGNDKTDTSSNLNDSTTVNNTSDGTSTDTANLKQMFSDTPQSVITDLETGKYLTNATINNNVTTGTSGDTFKGQQDRNSDSTGNATRMYSEDETANDLEDYTENFVGLQGKSGSELLTEFRNTFLNIDEMVMKEMRDLFFTLF